MKEKIKAALTAVFGRYEPAEWMYRAARFVKANTKPVLKVCLAVAGLIILGIVILAAIAFVISKRPVPMEMEYSVTEPSLADNPKSPLIIDFYGSAAKLEDTDKDVTSRIDIKPPIRGSWVWHDEETLVFIPEEAWEQGTEYKVTFSKGLFASHVKTVSSLKIKTEEFSIHIEDADFVIDDVNPDKKCIEFTLRSNFPMDTAELEKKITLVPDMKNPQNGTFVKKNYTVTLSYNDDKTAAYAVSETLGIPAKDVGVYIKVAKGITSAAGSSEHKEFEDYIVIPGASNYVKIEDIDISLVKNDNQEYDQILAVSATAKMSIQNLSAMMDVYVLPKDRPAEPGKKAYSDFDWEDVSTDNITDTVLKQSKRITPEQLPSEHEYQNLQTYRMDVPAGSHIYVRIKEGAKFYGGYYLAQDYETVRRVQAYPKEVHILSEGTLISMNGSRKIPILTRGIGEVHYTLWRMKPDEINHIVSMSNGDMRNFEFSRDWSFNQNNVSEVYRSSQVITASDEKKVRYAYFDFSNYLDTIPGKDLKAGLFLFRAANSRYDYDMYDERLILVTDQGLIIKKNANGERDVFVQSIATGQPIAGSTVKLVALNGRTLVSAVTDAAGHVHLPHVTYKEDTIKPVTFTASYGADFAFMPYEAQERVLDYSDFPVGGIYGAEDAESLRAYLFSDRGIYRPGDEIRIGMIVKAGDWNKKLGGLPFACVVTDPNGNEMYDNEFLLSEGAFDEIKFSTRNYSPTGIYTVSVYLKKTDASGKVKRQHIASETVKVEEFLPDTLNITTSFSPLPARGWIRPDALTAVVKLKNLFGTAAAGNTVKADVSLKPGYIHPAQYRDYTFSDPYKTDDSYEFRLEDEETDENGIAEFTIDTEKFANASYRLVFTADGLEKESGRAVSGTSSVYISPLEYLIGAKPDGDLSYIKKDSKRLIKFIALDSDLKACTVDDVEFSITERRFVSVLVKQPNGVYKYQSVKKEFPVSAKRMTIPSSGFEYVLPVETEGDFVLSLKNKNGIEYNSIAFSVIGEKNLQRSLSRTAELEVKLQKSDLRQGESAQLFIKAPYAGSGLIAVERDKVYTYKWFRSEGASSVQTIEVPHNLEGNGYITVMYTRSYNSPEIYMSPFCYAAVPFSVNLENRTNKIALDVPQEAKPGEDYTITYSSSKPGKIVIMAIDEGILQVAHYKTPAPLPFFFKKRALQVSTAQLLDLILPEFNILKTLTATGGGGDYEEALAHRLNPFKRKQNLPVAYWSGIIDTDSSRRSVVYRIPDYFNGKLRVMAIAVSDDSLGVAENATEVKDTYVIVPNMPVFASPKDRFNISVTVTNNDKGSGANAALTLSAKTDGGIKLLSQAVQKITVPEGKDTTVVYEAEVEDRLGNADIVFKAGGGTKSSKIVSSLSIRPSMPYQIRLTGGSVRKGGNQKKEINVDYDLYDEFASREVHLSYLPMGIAKGLHLFLEKYPYGCSEQVTSAAYPYLFPDLLKESGKAHSEAKEAVNNVVAILQSRQKNDGTIGYWTHKSSSYPEADAYYALFLTDARAQGFYVPALFMERLLLALENHASNEHTGTYAKAFCIYVLTKNERITTSYIEKLQKDMDKEDKMSLAGMYLAASYKMLHMDKEGEKILAKVKRGAKRADTVQRFEDDLYFSSAYLYLISEYYPEHLSVISDELLSNIEKNISDRKYTSLSSAFTLLAIRSFLEAVPASATGNFTLTEYAGKDSSSVLTPEGSPIFSAQFGAQAKKLVLENKEKRDLFYQTVQSGFLKNIPQKVQKDGIEVYKEFLNGSKAATNFQLGDEITVKIRVRATGKNSVYNVAVTDMLPSAFEADIESIRSSDSEWQPDYIDIREDRVVFFGTFTEKAQTFTYKARAIASGTFSTPPLYAEAMYDQSIRALMPLPPVRTEKK